MPRDHHKERPKKRLALRIARLIPSFIASSCRNCIATLSALGTDDDTLVVTSDIPNTRCMGSSQPRGGPNADRDISSIPKFLVALLLGCKGWSTPSDGRVTFATHWG
ncbi:uncharacterized protein TRIVIDRAFT_69706 [Trichoderma virens Gv29-8]|uniref:Uncharacterized protein n=1 Tax=Hypocrea virens (strain Gv29-8 / FGSC 10586) TaxID=413071 RepID=G9MXJ6_HYPVG|nr:uncharacterized protein TRIVIDRAFT_69706 [Trichoderma virens Gv29-8]EHK20894.1 hypothetical protein TRIVIDRAFT_69706 [Trichoderma virens Gv29-8]UKZ56838.1 hypothetical protein TrVGV298_010682 [Trichoderma virens]